MNFVGIDKIFDDTKWQIWDSFLPLVSGWWGLSSSLVNQIYLVTDFSSGGEGSFKTPAGTVSVWFILVAAGDGNEPLTDWKYSTLTQVFRKKWENNLLTETQIERTLKTAESVSYLSHLRMSWHQVCKHCLTFHAIHALTCPSVLVAAMDFTGRWIKSKQVLAVSLSAHSAKVNFVFSPVGQKRVTPWWISEFLKLRRGKVDWLNLKNTRVINTNCLFPVTTCNQLSY